ncbi:MAG: hypothetical protein HN401_00330 [Euryarchaeota archaeon]|nr:hypothetical protein [Euryarchaeota archaeon]
MLSVLRGIQRDGVAATIRRLNLNDLVGRSSTEILVGLTDTICPDGGSIDEGIARDAWLETLTELDQLGITDLGEMNSDQIQQFFLTFVTHAIETLLFQSIGTKGLSIAVDLVAIEAFELQLRDYIRRAVRDAFTRDLTMLEQMSDQDIKDIVDETYHNTWELLEMWGENQE